MYLHTKPHNSIKVYSCLVKISPADAPLRVSHVMLPYVPCLSLDFGIDTADSSLLHLALSAIRVPGPLVPASLSLENSEHAGRQQGGLRQPHADSSVIICRALLDVSALRNKCFLCPSVKHHTRGQLVRHKLLFSPR